MCIRDRDRETVVRLGAAIQLRLAGRPVRRLAVWLGAIATSLDGGAEAAAELITRGVVEGSFDPAALYRTGDAAAEAGPPVLDELILVVPGTASAAAATRAAQRGAVIGEGTNLTRRLANRSANDVSPQVLADETGAVGRRLAFVGKGVCFDSGGISIKPADRMDEMKMDKTGACTVLAAAVTAARLAPGVPLLAIAPAVENMPGPGASRPGDVVRAMNGKTVDIINTDAEGRLILGDAMTYAEHLGATHVVDVATLTGAVARAFGHLVTGAFGDPQPWYDELTAAAARAGERFWQLPLVDEYWPEMDSWTADMVNSSSPEAGLIKSALFLRQFVSVPWIHLDIAGSAYYRKPTAWAPHGATGVAVATLVELALAGAR